MTKKYNNIVDTYVCKSKGYAKLKDCNCVNCEMADKKKTLKKSGIHHLVLCENVVAANLNPFDLPVKYTLSIGTLVVAAKKVDNSKLGVVVSEYEKKHAKYFGKTWVCPLTSVVLVPPEILLYILPVPSQSRVHILKDKKVCENLEALQTGDEVYVLQSHGETQSRAMIKYKGQCPKVGEGVFFELELLENHEDNAFIIVASDRIRIKPPVPILPMISNGGNKTPSVNQLRERFESMASSLPRSLEQLSAPLPPVFSRVGKLIDISDEPLPQTPLKMGDHVLWMGDDGQLGGIIVDFCQPSEVILKLDKPVRSQMKPFRLQHEMRVPILELIKYEDFYVKKGREKIEAYSPEPCEKLCRENQRISQLERRPSPSSQSQCIALRNCSSGAPVDIPYPSPRAPLDRYLPQEVDFCDYPQELPPHYAPPKLSPNLSSSSSNLDELDTVIFDV